MEIQTLCIGWKFLDLKIILNSHYHYSKIQQKIIIEKLYTFNSFIMLLYGLENNIRF